MPRQRHYYGGNHLHFITASTYRRAKVFDSDRFRRHFIQALDELRDEFSFKILGYVLMPGHFHLLIGPSPSADPSRIVQSLKERTARFILSNLQTHRERRWCTRMLTALTLPPTVHLHGPHRVWQRRFYDLNVWSEKKRLEKLNYTHGNPVKRGIVASPDQWPWSSCRFYFLEDASILAMDPSP
jgi:REP-associated tyrosine transposase